MTKKQLNTQYAKYLREKTKLGAIISVSGFKRFILSKGISLNGLTSLEDWPRVRVELDIYYEDYLTEKAAAGGRNSQTFTQMLNKFYDRQAKRGVDKTEVKVQIDFQNVGKNKI